MPRKPIACPSCGALVSGGRLSCQSCGSLIAAVSAAKPAARTPPAKPAARSAAEPPAASTSGAGPAAPAPAAPIDAVPAVIRPSRSGSILSQLETRRPAPAPYARPNDPQPGTVRPVSPAIPGAYLAPSAAFLAPTPGARAVRVDESSFLRSTGGYAVSAAAATAPVAFAPNPPGPPEAGVASSVPAGGVSVQAPTELPGWLAIAGSAIAAVSFLMPWSRDGVIGAVGSGYFDRWGLANSGYLPLVLAALALLAINAIPNPIPTWIRAGVAPLLIGGVLFGLDWAYQTRPYSDGLGVTLLLIAAIVLVVGGILGVRPVRHQAAPPGV